MSYVFHESDREWYRALMRREFRFITWLLQFGRGDLGPPFIKISKFMAGDRNAPYIEFLNEVIFCGFVTLSLISFDRTDSFMYDPALNQIRCKQDLFLVGFIPRTAPRQLQDFYPIALEEFIREFKPHMYFRAIKIDDLHLFAATRWGFRQI